MNGTLAVAAQDLRGKWTVFVAALVAGLLAMVVPLVSSVGSHNTRDARDLAALIFASAFAFGVAVVGGAGMINRELVERRHGFLFARPLSAAAIWGGKVLACWLLAVGSGLVVLLPAAFASGGFHIPWVPSRSAGGAALVASAMAEVLLLILLAHALGLMARSRMPWLLALDAVLAVAVIVTVALALRPLVLAFAVNAATRGATAYMVILLVAAFAAGFAQVSLGRTDIRRGHRVLSATLWGTLGVAALLLAGYAHWVASVKPADLTNLDGVVLAPKGAWVFVTGRARGHADYEPSFLLDTATGRNVGLGAEGRWWLGAGFSADGTRAVWLSRPTGFLDRGRDVVTLDLTDPKAEPVTTRIAFARNHGGGRLDLSPDGRRLALQEGGTVSVFELGTDRLLASVRLAGDLDWTKVLWVGPESLGLATWQPTARNADQGDLRLFEFDLARRAMTETGRVAGVQRLGFAGLSFDPKTGHLLTRTGPPSAASLVLCDAHTGALLATLATCADVRGCGATILADGRIAVGEVKDAGVQLRLFSATGALQRTIPVGPGRALAVGGQPTAATVVIATRAQAENWSPGDVTAVLVDVDTGAVAPLGHGYFPLTTWRWWWGAIAPAPGSVAARAFIDPNRRLALLDPAAGTFRSVLSASYPAT
jgi:hypothetical protein